MGKPPEYVSAEALCNSLRNAQTLKTLITDCRQVFSVRAREMSYSTGQAMETVASNQGHRVKQDMHVVMSFLIAIDRLNMKDVSVTTQGKLFGLVPTPSPAIRSSRSPKTSSSTTLVMRLSTGVCPVQSGGHK